MLYALFLASCSMDSPIFLIVPLPYISLCLCVSAYPLPLPLSLGLCSLSLYLGYFLIELWDSLSVYAHSGIACLASQASDWLGALWASLSGFQSSVTLVKLLVIGHFL